MKKLVVEVESRSEMDCLIAVLSLGLLTAVEQNCLTADEAERYLFGPAGLDAAMQARVAPEVVDLVHRGLFLDDVQRMIPGNFPRMLEEMKTAALSVLRGQDHSLRWKVGWLRFKGGSDRANPIQAPLKLLLWMLGRAEQKHGGIRGLIKAQLSKVILHSFLIPQHGYTLPEEFGMPTPEGNRAIYEALSRFLSHLQMTAGRAELLTAEDRLKAFQDPDVRGRGAAFDMYFTYRADLMSKEIILPGGTIGILGSGQLGRMLALEARAMGYRVHTFSPDTDTPTGQVADLEVTAAYDDLDAVREFARGVDGVTFEFENVPAETVDAALSIVPVRPGGRVLHIAQHRGREKTWLLENGIPCAPFRHVGTREELGAALDALGTPAILKTAGFGYDGKGQVRIYDAAEADAAWDAVGGQPCVLEGFVMFEREISVVGVRGLNGEFVSYGCIQNSHVNGILDVSVCPVPDLPQALSAEAKDLTRRIMEGLEVVGVLCVEFFVTSNGTLLINEMAPRPHNSGHLTIEGHATSQFGQQLRAVCGLPLGPVRALRSAAMANLLGDLWADGEPDWAAALALRGVSQSHLVARNGVALHLYGKAEPKPGRKMGHLTALADTPEDAERLVRQARAALTSASAG